MVRLPNSEQAVQPALAIIDRDFAGKVKPEKDYIKMYTERVGSH